jgi:hypothetical protein
MACQKCNDCTDNGCAPTVYPKCILMDKAYPCLGITVGKTGKDLFDAVEAFVCNNVFIAPLLSWTALPAYVNNFADAGSGFQVGQYSNKLTSVIRLRGVLVNPNFDTGNPTICTLPVGSRPLSVRVFPTTVAIGALITAAFITITPAGVVGLTADSSVVFGSSFTTTLDGITFETN